MSDILQANLLSPIVLCFLLGVFAKLIKSEFALPKEIYMGISIYLLLALGLKGGVELSHSSFSAIIGPAAVTLLIGCITPLSAYLILRRLGRFSISDSAAIAAHYGSVSAVTFIAAQVFVHEMIKVDPSLPPLEGFMPTLLTLLESPGIHIALALGAVKTAKKGQSIKPVLHEVLTGRTMILLVGGLIVGYFMDPQGWEVVAPFYDPKSGIFKGLLCIFLLEMGVVAGSRMGDLKKVGVFLFAFGTIVPLLHGALAIVLGSWVGLSVGGCTVLAAMAASASYIAAPPAVRVTLPDANPSYYLTLALAITFPFNVTLGIPIYFELARLMV
ncbi:MAG: sodium-dependent bicarbonate transport family permease [Proteobacteria bacterium]|nr:sodium-dependent bicarbonate transport family permease [Pseudomonadota bacterium]